VYLLIIIYNFLPLKRESMLYLPSSIGFSKIQKMELWVFILLPLQFCVNLNNNLILIFYRKYFKTELKQAQKERVLIIIQLGWLISFCFLKVDTALSTYKWIRQVKNHWVYKLIKSNYVIIKVIQIKANDIKETLQSLKQKNNSKTRIKFSYFIPTKITKLSNFSDDS
jgi:hypothetical protein